MFHECFTSDSNADHYSRIDILHHFELSASRVDFWYRSRSEFIHHMAQDLAVLEDVFKGFTSRKLFAKNRLDPFLRLPFLLRVAFRRNLCKIMRKI